MRSSTARSSTTPRKTAERRFSANAAITSVLAVLTLVVIIMQTRIMYRQQVLMTQQSIVGASDRLEHIAAKQLEARLLAQRLQRMLNPIIVSVEFRTCRSERQCDTDVLNTIRTMKMSPRLPGLVGSNLNDDYSNWTANDLIAETLIFHKWASRILFGPVFESPYSSPIKQAQAVIEGIIEPAITKCGFSHPGGRELAIAMDTLATLAEANASVAGVRRMAMLRAINKLRRNFGDGGEGLDLMPDDPYPIKTYILQMRRMYLTIDWVPLALMKQCEKEEHRAATEYARVAEQTASSTNVRTDSTIADCKETKCNGLGGVMIFWRPVDGWAQWHDPKDVEEAEELARRAALAASAASSASSASSAGNSRTLIVPTR